MILWQTQNKSGLEIRAWPELEGLGWWRGRIRSEVVSEVRSFQSGRPVSVRQVKTFNYSASFVVGKNYNESRCVWDVNTRYHDMNHKPPNTGQGQY